MADISQSTPDDVQCNSMGFDPRSVNNITCNATWRWAASPSDSFRWWVFCFYWHVMWNFALSGTVIIPEICTACLTSPPSAFYPGNLFMCVLCLQQTAITCLLIINGLVFVIETWCVYCKVGTEFLCQMKFSFKGVRNRGILKHFCMLIR